MAHRFSVGARSAARVQPSQAPPEGGAKVDQALSSLDAVQHFRVNAQLRDAKVEHYKHSDARERVLCPRLISL